MAQTHKKVSNCGYNEKVFTSRDRGTRPCHGMKRTRRAAKKTGARREARLHFESFE